MTDRNIRVIAVDDSAMSRHAYRLLLQPEDGFELVATAPNATIARRKLVDLDPDVLILDIEMPGEDGLSLLQWVMQEFPLPVVVSSSYSSRGAEQTMRALSLGAVEVLCKDSPARRNGWSDDFGGQLSMAVRAAASVRRKARFPGQAEMASRPPAVDALPRPRAYRLPDGPGCVVIGASTGGTEALAHLVAELPEDFPPTLIVQHMPSLYTRTFAERLDRIGAVNVSEARHGQRLRRGDVVVAPGGQQMRVMRGSAGPLVRISDEGPHNRHAPSVDVLFHSAADNYGEHVIGVLLTGMGKDGAEGLLRIRENGGLTYAQDEASCVVYGMPREALRCGAVEEATPLDRMIPAILEQLSRES